MSEYIFKGYDWTELSERWGINAEPRVINFTKDFPSTKEDLTLPETIDVTHMINDIKMVFTINNAEEVIAEKTKRYISEQLMFNDNPSVRNDINRFLEALANESEYGDGGDSNFPVYRALLSIKCNHTFGKWIVNNLEDLWS